MYKAYWIVWSGWAGNHDRRIENATCSSCGHNHTTVKGDLDLLSPYCPTCGSKMGVIEE